jgi:hypothetical protein
MIFRNTTARIVALFGFLPSLWGELQSESLTQSANAPVDAYDFIEVTVHGASPDVRNLSPMHPVRDRIRQALFSRWTR